MNRRMRYILIGVAIIGVALAVFFLLVNPIHNDINDLNDKKAEEQRQIDALTLQLKQYQELRERGRWNEARLLELAKMMPEKPEVPSLIIQLQYLADKAGIDMMQISPGEPMGGEGSSYQTMTLAVTFRGTFYDLVDFMDRTESMVGGPGRLLTVKTLSISPSPVAGAEDELSVNMTLYAFVVPTQ